MNLNQVTLPATDLARSVEFYRMLGFTLIVSDLPTYARFECPLGDSTFSLSRVDRMLAGEGVVVYFECPNLDETYAKLRSKGIPFDTPPEDKPWLWREALLRDPDGNSLCLFQAGEARRNPPWRVVDK